MSDQQAEWVEEETPVAVMRKAVESLGEKERLKILTGILLALVSDGKTYNPAESIAADSAADFVDEVNRLFAEVGIPV